MKPLDPTTGSPERVLWLMVIELALKDLVFGSANLKTNPIVDHEEGTDAVEPLGNPGVADPKAAEAWIFRRGYRKDFEAVCSMAAVSPDKVREVARGVLNGTRSLRKVEVIERRD